MKTFCFSFRPQRAGQNRPNRKDHVWFSKGEKAKCALCGAVTAEAPPRPEPEGWEPERYEPLTDEERALCPMSRRKP